MKGLVAFSFGLRPTEPNLCNKRLARAVERIVRKERDLVVVVSQWEITMGLGSIKPAHVVEKPPSGQYLDSDEVMRQASRIFRECGITEVIAVGQPFLHLWRCQELVREAGFIPVRRKIGWIGFCWESLQWWTRSPVHLFVYSVLQKTVGRKGH